jgi:chromosome segregation ATPase
LWKIKRVLFITLLFAASLFLCWVSVGSCSGNPTYTISESELETLQNHLNVLEQNNETLKAILSESDESLTAALDALMKSQQELTTLKIQLERAKNDALSAQESLKTANLELERAAESFRQSEKERDRIENRLRNQRNIWEVLCLVAVGVAVAR